MSADVSRLYRLWQIDLIRHGSLAFTASVIATSTIIVLAFGVDIGAVPNVVFESRTADAERHNRQATIHYAREAGAPLGIAEAQRRLPGLLENGTADEGYDEGFRRGWNQVIVTTSRRAPLQLDPSAEGTQWIELLK